jgi:hypothetical protein
MNRLPNGHDLTDGEMAALRLIVAQSFMSRSSLSAAHHARLVELDLIRTALGGVMATPAGRMVGRR